MGMLSSAQQAGGKRSETKGWAASLMSIFAEDQFMSGPHKQWASLVAQLIENPPAVWEAWVRPLGWEDPLEKGKDTHFSILAV